MRRHFMATVVARALGSCLQAIMLVLLARTVEQAIFGLANALLGLGAIAAVLADLGLTTYIVKVWAFDRDAERVVRALRISNYAAIVLAVALTALFAAAAYVYRTPLYLCFLAIWIALEKCTEAYLSVHTAEQRVLAPSASIILRRVIPLALFAALLRAGLDPLLAFVASLTLGGFIGQAHACLALPKFFRKAKSSVRPRTVLRECGTFGFATLASQIRNADTFIVSLFAGLAASGSFAAATKLTIPIYLVASAVALSIMPGVARAGATAVKRIAYILIGATCASIILLAVVSPWLEQLMTLVYGPAYADRGSLLWLVLVGTVFGGVGFPLAALLQSIGRAATVAMIEVGSALLVVLGMSVGAAAAGATGAAIGAIAAQVVRAGLLVVLLLISHPTPAKAESVSPEGAIR